MSDTLSAHDTDVLRRLAHRKAEIALAPANLERRDLWYRHDAGTGGRPMVLAEIGGLRDRLLPIPDTALECTDPWARGLERRLRIEVYQFEVLRDDHVVEPFVETNWQVEVSGYGVQPTFHHTDNDGHLAARRWDPALKDLDRDLGHLQPRTYCVDRQATQAEKERLERVLGGILPVRLRGGFWWTLGMTWTAIELIGLDQLMLSMYDNPAGLHRLMAFLRDESLRYAAWLEDEGLLALNNENDYIGSGSMGYTRALPADGRRRGDAVRTQDLWVLLESQETVGVGPDQFAEFVFPYQEAIARRFGRAYYGCCEPVHTRLHVLRRLPNLARISVSPWADQEQMARQLGAEVVFSRKPNPTLVSTRVFDEEAIRADLRRTLDVTRGCRVELIMKDVHTLDDEPARLPRWVELARRAIDET
ncbi:MAG: hypothetical protein AB1505_30380 [Candidatus Latescibacterota bacterium]